MFQLTPAKGVVLSFVLPLLASVLGYGIFLSQSIGGACMTTPCEGWKYVLFTLSMTLMTYSLYAVIPAALLCLLWSSIQRTKAAKTLEIE